MGGGSSPDNADLVEQVRGALAVVAAVEVGGDLLRPVMAQWVLRFEGVAQQRRVMPVGRRSGDPEWDAVAVDASRTFHAALAAVDQGTAGLGPQVQAPADRPVGTPLNGPCLTFGGDGGCCYARRMRWRSRVKPARPCI